MSDKKEEAVETVIDEHAPMYETSNRAARSMVAVIHTMCQRGGFKGEELSTIGQLRDQCVQIVALAETEIQNMAQE